MGLTGPMGRALDFFDASYALPAFPNCEPLITEFSTTSRHPCGKACDNRPAEVVGSDLTELADNPNGIDSDRNVMHANTPNALSGHERGDRRGGSIAFVC